MLALVERAEPTSTASRRRPRPTVEQFLAALDAIVDDGEAAFDDDDADVLLAGTAASSSSSRWASAPDSAPAGPPPMAASRGGDCRHGHHHLLHWVNADVEVHKVVVGPYDNNVFVVRCRRTGDAVLIDAANEHEQLLELCQRLGVRRVLETHGHWDHIQAVPAIREAGYEVAVTKLDAPKLTGRRLRRVPRRRRGDRGRRPPPRRDPQPRPHARARSRSTSGARRCCSPATRCSPAARATRSSPTPTSTTIIRSIETPLFTFPDTTIVLPGHGVDTTIGAERPHLDEWIARGW